jgi:hypothetical protein
MSWAALIEHGGGIPVISEFACHQAVVKFTEFTTGIIQYSIINDFNFSYFLPAYYFGNFDKALHYAQLKECSYSRYWLSANKPPIVKTALPGAGRIDMMQ